MRNALNKDILRLAVPAIFTNITVPLLGLVDFAISGHLGSLTYIGAISVGTMMFNLLYWNFGFLRMGTSGLTAQAYGAGDARQQSLTLYRAVAIAVALGLLLVALQVPLRELMLWLLSPSAAVAAVARKYFSICIWGAPFFLTTMVLKGWFLGMQNSRFPMIIAIAINVINIALSAWLVFALGLSFYGIAIGTLAAEVLGFALALTLLRRRYAELVRLRVEFRRLWDGVGRFFRVNADIFLRSFFLLSVNFAFTSIGARAGDEALAVNSLMMQLFLFYSYFVDGFAYAGEAIVGKLQGARQYRERDRAVVWLLVWGFAIAVLFTLSYWVAIHPIAALLTDSEAVIAGVAANYLWCVAVPLVGVWAFIGDGVFVGLTATRAMLLSTLSASALFFATYFGIGGDFAYARLWTAFLLFLALRGVVLWSIYLSRYAVRRQRGADR